MAKHLYWRARYLAHEWHYAYILYQFGNGKVRRDQPPTTVDDLFPIIFPSCPSPRRCCCHGIVHNAAKLHIDRTDAAPGTACSGRGRVGIGMPTASSASRGHGRNSRILAASSPCHPVPCISLSCNIDQTVVPRPKADEKSTPQRIVALLGKTTHLGTLHSA